MHRKRSKLRDKVILITGASSGIGYALAKELSHLGARLVLAARRTDRLSALKHSLGQLSHNVTISKCDVTSTQDLEQTVEEAHQNFGKIDIVIANAAIPMQGEFEQLTLENYRTIFETNIFGVLGTCYAALEDLKQTGGTLVLIGSISSYMSSPGSSAYAMSKFAVRAFAEAARSELARYGIKVVLISPGFIKSEHRLIDNRGVFHPEYKDWAPSFLVMPAKKAARQIARAITRGGREKFITWHGYMSYWVRQYLPWLYFLLVDFFSSRFRPDKS